VVSPTCDSRIPYSKAKRHRKNEYRVAPLRSAKFDLRVSHSVAQETIAEWNRKKCETIKRRQIHTHTYKNGKTNHIYNSTRYYQY